MNRISVFIALFSVICLVLNVPSTRAAFGNKGVATLKGASYQELLEADAPFYLSYTLTAQQDLINSEKTFSVILVDTINYERIKNGTYEQVQSNQILLFPFVSS